jgi:acetylornithine/N-succinyldiaminopimelate aminotransferase
VLKGVRGLGFMIGLEFAPKEQVPALAAHDKAASLQVVNRLHSAGLLTVPSGTQIIRFLPPLNLRREEASEGLALIEKTVKELA